MNFYSSEFLLQHCQDILKFYDDKVVDPSGGYFHNYLDDGTLFAPGFRQLVRAPALSLTMSAPHCYLAVTTI